MTVAKQPGQLKRQQPVDLVDGPPAKRTRQALRTLANAATAAELAPPVIREASQPQTEQLALPDDKMEVPESLTIRITRTKIVVKNRPSKAELKKDIRTRRLAKRDVEVAST